MTDNIHEKFNHPKTPKTMRKIAAFILLITTQQYCFATEHFNGSAEIKKIVAFSSNRPVNTITQNLVRLELASDYFAGTPCAGGWANVAKTDTPVIALAMTAAASKSLIQLAVDDTLKIDNTCQVTFLKISQ